MNWVNQWRLAQAERNRNSASETEAISICDVEALIRETV